MYSRIVAFVTALLLELLSSLPVRTTRIAEAETACALIEPVAYPVTSTSVRLEVTQVAFKNAHTLRKLSGILPGRIVVALATAMMTEGRSVGAPHD
jgi:hypothetical protein